MPRKKKEQRTRQIYAAIREDLYLAAKARSTELRIPLRELIEQALEMVLKPENEPEFPASSLWEDEYLRIQADQPLGSPVELTKDEAAKVVRHAFGPAQ